jgi:hypothetical protein
MQTTAKKAGLTVSGRRLRPGRAVPHAPSWSGDTQRFLRLRIVIGAAIITALSVIWMTGPQAASASVVSSSRDVIVWPGGMVRTRNSVVPATAPDMSAKVLLPGCSRIEYVGNSGFIAVQERNHKLQWGIVMTPLAYSIGKWNVSTYLSGKKTTSGFYRTVTIGYIPHGSLSVPPNKVFHVQAEVVGPDGTFFNAPNACRT